MWELIEINKKKSFLLFLSLGACLFALGYFMGHTAFGDSRSGGMVGLIIAGAIWIVWSLYSYYCGDSAVLAAANAKAAKWSDYPQLYNIVDEIRIAANQPVYPRLYIIDCKVANAFATGRSPQKCAIAVTTGLLAILNRDELQGVIAHEMSHIINRDIMLLTFAGVTVGVIHLLSDIFLHTASDISRGRWFSDTAADLPTALDRGTSFCISLLLSLLLPIIATLFYFAISRNREYLADAMAVRLTRYPEGLASALEKIEKAIDGYLPVSTALSPIYINQPLNAWEPDGWLDTHPPILRRIKILRKMAGTADYQEYQKAYRQINEDSLSIPGREATMGEPLPIREASLEKDTSHSAESMAPESNSAEKPGDLINDLPLARHSENKLPPSTASAKQIFSRTPGNWQTIICDACGAHREISPAFDAPFVTCNCGRRIYRR